MEDLIDMFVTLGWVANVCLIAGLIMVGQKRRSAWLWTASGELLWLVESAMIERLDMCCLCVVFAVLAIRNWVIWGKRPRALAVTLPSKVERPTPERAPDPASRCEVCGHSLSAHSESEGMCLFCECMGWEGQDGD